MEILVVANGIASFRDGPNISGGDVRFLEIARRWLAWGHHVRLLTPPAGAELARRFGVQAEIHSLDIIEGAGFVSYAHRAFSSCRLPKSLNGFKGAVYSSTEHFYDAVPAAQLARQGNPWACVVHLVSPPPWRRKGTGLINATLFYAQQRIGLNLVKRYAQAALAVSPATAQDFLAIGAEPSKVHVVSCGVDSDWFQQEPKQDGPKFDGIYMGRLHPEKGVFDLVEIWAEVCQRTPNARLAVMGLGTDDIKKRMQARAAELHIVRNIEFLGPVYDIAEKLSILQSARVFLMPSHSENWGIVIGEALAAGLPAVCFDLPSIRPVWQRGVRWVPLGDHATFADEVSLLLHNVDALRSLRQEGREFARRLSWDSVAAHELQFLQGFAR